MASHDTVAAICESMNVDMETVMNTWEAVCIANDLDVDQPHLASHFQLIRGELKQRRDKVTKLQKKAVPRVRNAVEKTPLKELKFNMPKWSSPITPKASPFTERRERLTLISSINEHIPFVPGQHAPQVALLHELKPYRYGYKSLDGDELNARIEAFEQIFEQQTDTKDPETIESIPKEEMMDTEESREVTLVGFICSDALEYNKLNPMSIVLQTSRRENLYLKLNLDKLTSFALFPGQMVQVKGMQVGESLFVSQLNIPDLLPFPMTPVSDLKHLSPLNYVIAAGPFTLNENLEFEPLQELVKFILEKRPNLIVLMGPFLPEEHPMIQRGQLMDMLHDIFKSKVGALLNEVQNALPLAKLIIIPSSTDLLCDTPCLPQPPFPKTDFLNRSLELAESILCFSNPVQCTIDHTVFAVISQDVLLSLASCETVHQMPQDRMARLVKNILSQRTFTPTLPGTFKSFDPALDLIVSPDILILPSLVKPFIKNIDGCIVINPGQTCKAMGTGTFVYGCLHPFDEDALNSLDETHVLNMVDERMRVDIMKL